MKTYCQTCVRGGVHADKGKGKELLTSLLLPQSKLTLSRRCEGVGTTLRLLLRWGKHVGGCERGGKLCEETAERCEAMGRKRVPSFWGSTRFVCVFLCVTAVTTYATVRPFCVSIDYFLMYYVEASCKYVVNSGTRTHAR